MTAPPRGAPVAVLVVVLLLGALLAAPVRAEPATFDLQAHRGGRGETTESSPAAFAHALRVGVDTLELDVVLTADRRPLVWHDPVIEAAKCRDTAPAVPADPAFPYVGKRVHDLTLAQVRTLDCGIRLPEFPAATALPGTRLATLPEVFDLVAAAGADVGFNIETKVEADDPAASASPAEFVEVILAAVRAAGLTDRVIIQSFDWRTLPLVRRAEPAIRLAALWEEHTWRPGSPWLAGVDPADGTDPLTAVRGIGADIASPPHQAVDAVFVQRAHALGLAVIPWTVNDAATLRAQIDAGVDGVITDYPSMAREVLAGLGMPLPRAYPG
ncbi:glycerophosphodiester phosphodiesterase [Mycolicibacillus trivialis]|uniref:Glycerophosphodiester phosphodiesterase n=1 Tax=Mycolicibacillus trivialis TaxID=1798 RepID=A0A1X2EHF5_9MYCO|nr:glycerophosphodiester phosphodiesterase [Mycolicibacillus trivialis]ORX02374.1 glycerophosphodiester phosphodiesterase [Mycolicibacillus trivialis]